MAPLADAVTEAVIAELDRPVVLFGHSLGALTAFEVAVRLCRSPRTAPVALVVAAHRPPALGSAGLAHHMLPEDELVRLADGMGGTPGAALANPAIRRLFVPVLRADFQLDHGYEYRHTAPLDIPISAFGGDRDPMVPAADISGWSVHTTGEFRARIVRGGHFFHTESGGADMFADMSAALLDHIRTFRATGEGEPAHVRG
jgi:surfactin synthase thioesterase subunit